jgi:hypothetical protein
MFRLRFLVAAILAYSLLPAPAFAQGFYAIAHMTNTAAAVDWALGQGANGVEMDLQFDAAGKPTFFKHGGICDCTCIVGTDGIGKALTSVCAASTNAVDLLEHVSSKIRRGARRYRQ